MNPLVIAPVVLPALLAPLILLAMRHNIRVQRIVTMAGLIVLWLLSLRLILMAGSEISVYSLGNWPAPFGIVLVLDRLSALMLGLTASLALIASAYAIASGWDTRGKHFHALFLFQIMGLNGAFLTGDAFNLFVFFEILLIASYGLMIHSGGALRLRAGVQYMVFNLAGSTLFLFALGTIYAVTGTLNMADLAVRVAQMPVGDVGLLRVGVTLLLAVFAIKAALIPLQFWLPATYANAPAPVAALFAVMTKVGAYAILRTFTLIFPPATAATAGISDYILPAAVLTLVLGVIGSLGANTVAKLAAFATIASMGTLLIAFGQLTPASTTAGLYYMLHSTFAAAALFLIADLIAVRRGNTTLTPAPQMQNAGLIAALFFIAAIGMAGMPPLSGFIGKLLILKASTASPHLWLIWAVILITSLVSIIAFARAGSLLFWNTTPEIPLPRRPRAPLIVTGTLLALMAALTALSAPILNSLANTATQLHTPARYIAAVLGPAP